MSDTAKPPPDYWVVKLGNAYLARSDYPNLWAAARWNAARFRTLESANRQVRQSNCRVIAVRRKPTVRTRVAELVARCKAAIDAHRAMYPSATACDLRWARVGGHSVDAATKVLDAIDPAAAAEIRAYWEKP